MSGIKSKLYMQPLELPDFGYALSLLLKGGSLTPQGFKYGKLWPAFSGVLLALRIPVAAEHFYGYVAAFLFLNVAWALQFMLTHRRWNHYPKGLTGTQFLIGMGACLCVAVAAIYFVVLQVQAPLLETPEWYTLVKILWIILL